MFQMVLAELQNRYRAQARYEGSLIVTRDDIIRWSKQSGLSVRQLFDDLAIELAGDFWIGLLGYDFAVSAANALDAALMDVSNGDESFLWPEPFEEFRRAFDHSESVGVTGRELIREFLEKHRTLDG